MLSLTPRAPGGGGVAPTPHKAFVSAGHPKYPVHSSQIYFPSVPSRYTRAAACYRLVDGCPAHLKSRFPPPHRTRQSARHLCRLGRSRCGPHLHRDRSHLGLRPRARVGNPGQGPHPHADLALLVRPFEEPRSEPRGHRRRRPVPCLAAPLSLAARRAHHAGPTRKDVPRGVRRPRLPLRLRLEGLPGDGRGVRHRAAGGF